MKVLMVAGDPRIENFGGVEEHVTNLTYFLSQIDDIDLSVMAFGSKCSYMDKNKIHFHTLKRLTDKRILYVLLLPFDLYRILRIVRKCNPDVVHFQGTHPLYCLAAIFTQNKYHGLLTVHGILAVETKFQAEQTSFFKFFSKRCEQETLSRVKNMIIVAPEIKSIVQNMTKSKIWVVPNGVDLDYIQKVNPLDVTRKNSIFFIGNLVKRKGIDNLIKALSLAKLQISDVFLFIAGTGPQEKELNGLVSELSLGNNVKFLGFIDKDLKYSYMKSANALIVPSRWESLPIVVLEGMACGKPIIASSVGGIPFLVKNNENGYLVEAEDIDGLANKIISLLYNKDLQVKMGATSLERVKQFTWDNIADQTAKIYRELIKES